MSSRKLFRQSVCERVSKTRLVFIFNKITNPTNFDVLASKDSDRWARYQYKPLVSPVSTDNFSLTKIICHRNFDNEFAFTHSKDYLYYLALSPLSQIFDNGTSPKNLIYKSIFSATNLLFQRKNVRGN